jgi:hypothetical protein
VAEQLEDVELLGLAREALPDPATRCDTQL